MDCDEILIGSGLSALGVALGLPLGRRVLVIGGPRQGRVTYYEPLRTVPCACVGYGGLGNYWHGVIPVGQRQSFAGSSREAFETLFRWFYPYDDLAERYGKPLLFVPWRPIRPDIAWRRLMAERGANLSLIHDSAVRLRLSKDRYVEVETDTGLFRATRVWLCSGALQTPVLISRSFSIAPRMTASDHVLCYLGQVDLATSREICLSRLQRTRSGVWFEARYSGDGNALLTLRPARFDYRRLDHGIEQRAAFGLPTRSAVMKIFAGVSPGLLAEALYNRMGLFPGSRIQSLYAQFPVPEAHWYRNDAASVTMRLETIRSATDALRANTSLAGLIASRRPDIFIPMIHLHHTLNAESLAQAGINTPGSAVQIVDASIHTGIGPEHHSFKMMVAAFARARALNS